MSAAPKPPPDEIGFSDTYPEAIGERLAWFARGLGVGEGRLLNLLGVAPSAAPYLRSGGVDWQALARQHEDEACWAEAILYDALALFNYDIEAMRRHLTGSAARDFPILGPGGVSVAAGKLRTAERDRALLALLAAGGPVGWQALLAYLAQPGDLLPVSP